MHREEETEVLVVGAGPVGLLTALMLSGQGVQVKIIDQATQAAARSYACALHSRTLGHLKRLGLLEEVLEMGHKIETIAFYEGATRRAELKLADLPVQVPYVVLLPQTELEQLLEHELQRRFGVRVHWSHRLSDLQQSGETVVAAIDKLVETAKGYIVPEWEWVVEKTVHIRAAFLVGADGPNSHVRQCLQIQSERFTGPEFFAVYEFASDGNYANEMGIVLGKSIASVFWPLSDHNCRWSFQLPETEVFRPFPEKETRALRVAEPIVDEEIKEHLHRFLQERAPWFEGSIQEVLWSTEVQFAPQLARRFGEGHCWLIGDAAHQTGPIGVQSMNVGMCEAEALASLLIRILRENVPSARLLESFQSTRRQEWEQLLGVKTALKPAGEVPAWIEKHCGQILPCLPASGEDLQHLLGKLGLGFRPSS